MNHMHRLLAFYSLATVILMTTALRSEASAIAENSIAFDNFQAHVLSGTFDVWAPWSINVHADARNSLGEHGERSTVPPGGKSPGVFNENVSVTWAQSAGRVSAPNNPPDLALTGSSSSAVNLPNKVGLPAGVKNAWGNARGYSSFANAIGFVELPLPDSANVTFSVHVNGFLHVATTENGLDARTFTDIDMNINDAPIMHDVLRLEVGSNSEEYLAFDKTLTVTKTLETLEPFSISLHLYSYSHADVPSPSTIALMLIGVPMLSLFTKAGQRGVNLS